MTCVLYPVSCSCILYYTILRWSSCSLSGRISRESLSLSMLLMLLGVVSCLHVALSSLEHATRSGGRRTTLVGPVARRLASLRGSALFLSLQQQYQHSTNRVKGIDKLTTRASASNKFSPSPQQRHPLDLSRRRRG